MKTLSKHVGSLGFATLAGLAVTALFAPAAQAQVRSDQVLGVPVVVLVSEDPGWTYRTPFRPDLIVRQGSGRNCNTTYEQTMTTDGLVWRPLVMCPIQD